MLVSLEYLYFPEEKKIGGFIDASLEHLYLQNAGTSGRTKTLGHLGSVSQSGISDPPGGKIFLGVY